METIVLSLLIVGLAVLGLATGVVFGRQPIKGSCGGLACIKKLDCEDCPHRLAEGDRQ
ncbi:(Na+)-NQR maturation NqrM [Pelagibacterium limicola]|uniref:(Na+)-NQR maturation NqrM n=1 Tax=Pelagibacterium limicola TaxID=2791022 RepID=UPI0018B00DC8|nr:(Na+)-NQR maturation NqrM [Pelagibacterium limicola]